VAVADAGAKNEAEMEDIREGEDIEGDAEEQ
jgi:hypothetical protein